jgi:hypothetical protein
MHVDGYGRSWQVADVAGLEEVLAWRDACGGAEFWLSHEKEKYPVLAMRVSGDIADVHFFPKEGHPGFRSLGGAGLASGGRTTLIFQGCDPASGEETPNQFVVPFELACSIAKEFFHRKQTSDAVSWFEL